MILTQLSMSFALGMLELFLKFFSQMYWEVECITLDYVIDDCQTVLSNKKYFFNDTATQTKQK